MLYASFVPILKPLPHLAQFLHVSAVLMDEILLKIFMLLVGTIKSVKTAEFS